MDSFENNKLRSKLLSHNFPIGVELTSSRGLYNDLKNEKVIKLANQLNSSENVDWISITDNAGGHPGIDPQIIAENIQNLKKDIIIHLTCKDLNRNGLESKLWSYGSKSFNNILALTGDYPQNSYKGISKPVFDLDAVTLLKLISDINSGTIAENSGKYLKSSSFFAGAAVSNFKKSESETMLQYYKLLKKIENGASFIIQQVGFDAKKIRELKLFLSNSIYSDIPLIGNIYLLSKFTSKLFYENKIPGIVLTDELYNKCVKYSASPDKGKHFFIEFAAKMLSIIRGLKFNAAYLGGIQSIEDLDKILEMEQSFSHNDWKLFAKEINYNQKNEFFLFDNEYEFDEHSSHSIILLPNFSKASLGSRIKYKFSDIFHNLMFTTTSLGYKFGRKISSEKYKNHIPGWIHFVEKFSKVQLYDCKDCGDCGLQYTAYICPESQCPKSLRNGPCGGSHNQICEVKEHECIWVRAYDRLKFANKSTMILKHCPAIKNNGLNGTSSWANFWLEKDYGSKLLKNE